MTMKQIFIKMLNNKHLTLFIISLIFIILSYYLIYIFEKDINDFNIDAVYNTKNTSINITNLDLPVKILDYFNIYCPAEDSSNSVQNVTQNASSSTNTSPNSGSSVTNTASSSTSNKTVTLGSVTLDTQNKNLGVSLSKEILSETAKTAGSALKQGIKDAGEAIGLGLGIGGAMGALGKALQNTPGTPLQKTTYVVGGALVTGVGMHATRIAANNIQDQLRASRFNDTNLPEGRAPSPDNNFGIHSMLDNFELSNFTLTIPTNGNSPLETLLNLIFTNLSIVILLFIYLSIIIIMQVFTKNYADNIIAYLDNPGNLKYFPVLLKRIIRFFLNNFFNLNKSTYKYVTIFVILAIIYFLGLSIVCLYIINKDVPGFIEVYNSFNNNK